MMVDKLVIKIGLNLIEAASNTATSKFFPLFLFGLQTQQLKFHF